MKSILVIQTASIGDVILATSILESLHRKFPETQLSILVKKGNEALFQHHPYLSEVLVWNKRNEKYLNLFRIIRMIRIRRFDLVINVQRFFTSGLITVLSGAGQTRGFRKNPLSWGFTKKADHEIGTGIHEVARNQKLIDDLTGADPLRPALYPAADDTRSGHLQTGESAYTISPASLWFTKQFPVEKWVEFIRLIPPSGIIYLLGSPSDQHLCEEIRNQSEHPGIVNLAGKLSFLQSAALMKKVAMNFTNDSAPMHLAAAVDAPVTAVFCSTVPAFGFTPYCSNSRVVETDSVLRCRPCGLHGYRHCPEKHFRCGLEIDVKKLTARL